MSFRVDGYEKLMVRFDDEMIVGTDVACLIQPCGEGTCVVSNATMVGFECVCKPGWQLIKVGALTYPACLIPNCMFYSLPSLLYLSHFI